jgi:two-component system KDP operon response regulator KdpE
LTRVLVVDDSPQILATLRINLRARHYDVRVATDAGRALAWVADWRPDLVVLDLGLPDAGARPEQLINEPGMGYRFEP